MDDFDFVFLDDEYFVFWIVVLKDEVVGVDVDEIVWSFVWVVGFVDWFDYSYVFCFFFW